MSKTVTLPSIRTTLGGLVAGIVSFILGFAITYLWRGDDIEQSLGPIQFLLELFQAEPIETWHVVGWMYYSAHFVDTRITAQFGPGETTFYVDLVREGSGNLELLYLVPVALLLLAGLALAIDAASTSFADGAVAGATVTVGYLLAVLIGLVLFAYNGIRPDPVPAVLVAGVLYPLVFGAIGGAIGSQLTE